MDALIAMKRASDYERRGGLAARAAGGDAKRARSRFEVRLLIPTRVAGSIIGKGGHNIQRLRTQNEAGIRIPDCPAPERIMSILVDDVETACRVVEQTMPFMNEEAGRAKSALNDASSQDVRVLVHQSVVGGVIGRSGYKIKEIRENSGAGIKVYGHVAPQSTDRCISIYGPPEKVVAALHEVLEIVRNTEIKGPEHQYDPINFDAYYAEEYGGFGGEGEVMGGGGRSAMRGSTAVAGQMGNPFGMETLQQQEQFLNSFMPQPGSRGASQAYGHAGLDQTRHVVGGGRGGRRGPPPSMNAGMGGGRYQQNNVLVACTDTLPVAYNDYVTAVDDTLAGPEETSQVTIPKDVAGAIIGPGGSRIRKIRMDSKASITIEEPLAGSDERIITITGTQQSIQLAQYLLQQTVRQYADTRFFQPEPASHVGGWQ